MKKTLFQVLKEKYGSKPATEEEIKQLELDLKRAKIKAEIKKVKSEGKGTGLDNFNHVVKTLFGDGNKTINI